MSKNLIFGQKWPILVGNALLFSDAIKDTSELSTAYIALLCMYEIKYH